MSFVFQNPPFNYQYQVGLANAVDSETAQVSLTSPQTLGALQTLVLPSNLFAQNGQKVSLFASGLTDNVGGVSTHVIRLNGLTTIFSGTKAAAGASTAWELVAELMRDDNDLISSTKFYHSIGAAGAAAIPVISAQRAVLANYNFNQNTLVEFLWTNAAAGTDHISQQVTQASII